MKRLINLRLLVWFSLFVITIFASALTTFAQDEPVKVFKKGDHVKVSPLGQDTEESFQECVVLSVIVWGQVHVRGYEVKCAPQFKGAESKSWSVTWTHVKASDQQDRPEIKDNNQPAEKTNKNKTANTKKGQRDFDDLADREILACDFKQPSAKNGSAPPPELAKKLIRCKFEKHANPGEDGAATVDINEFQIGKSRQWRIREDFGDGDQNTIVYPILVSWTWKTFYQSRTAITESTDVFNCFVNSFNKWECGLGKRVKEGQTKSIPRQ